MGPRLSLARERQRGRHEGHGAEEFSREEVEGAGRKCGEEGGRVGSGLRGRCWQTEEDAAMRDAWAGGDPSTTRLRRWRQHGLDTLTLDVTRVRPRTLHACAQQSDPSQFPRLETRVLLKFYLGVRSRVPYCTLNRIRKSARGAIEGRS